MIFEQQLSRKPDHYPWAKPFIDAMNAGHWDETTFKFATDAHDFKVKLSDSERDMVKKTLAAIAQIEIGVKEFWKKLGDNLPHPSLDDLGITMAKVEVIHNNAYEKLLTVLGLENVFEENMNLDIIQGRAKYLKKHNHRYYESHRKQYIYALILFTLYIENISLFSQFYVIKWLSREKIVLKDTANQIAYTEKEETLHAMAGIKIINTIREEHPEFFDDDLMEKVTKETIKAIESEDKIIDWIVGEYEGEGLSAAILKNYIRQRANDSLVEIQFKPIFETDAALTAQTRWMKEEVYGKGQTDFFFSTPTEYAHGGQTFDDDDCF